MAIVSNRDDDLKYKKSQIDLFFSAHADMQERAEYLESAYHDRFTEILVDGERFGYRPRDNGLLIWEGAFLSHTRESVFSWETVAEWVSGMVEKKEYYVNTNLPAPKTRESQQLSLFDLSSLDEPAPQEATEQALFVPRFRLSQQVIDTALCLGGNEPDCIERIYSFFSKDYPLERNAAFLKKEYGRNGKGFFLGDKPYAVWFDENGLRVSYGKTAIGSYATALSWEDVAKRVRELLDLGRYVPQSVIDRADEVEKKTLAGKLLDLIGDFTQEAREAGYIPTVQAMYSIRDGYPIMTERLQNSLNDRSIVQNIIDELQAFIPEREENYGLLRFNYHNLGEILDSLQGLQRETVSFPAPEPLDPAPQQFISEDEIDKLLIGGGNVEHSKFRIYSYYREGHTPKERLTFLKNEYGTGGTSRLGFDENHDSKGISYAREDRLFHPYDKVLLPWNKVEKRIDELIRQGRYMTEKELAYIPTYEKEELARRIYHFFGRLPLSQPCPYPPKADYYEAMRILRPQLDDPVKVEEIYRMMVPIWESTAPDDRYYIAQKEAFESITAYCNGTFTLFNEKKEPKPLFDLSAVYQPELATQQMADAPQPTPEAETELDQARELINAYCMETFEEEADYSNLAHVDLAFGSTSDSEHTVEVYADLVSFRLVYEVGGESVREIACEQLADLNGYLANLDFDAMIADAEDAFLSRQQTQDTPELPAEEEQPPAALAPAKPKRERVLFSTLHPEIPAAQRRNFHISDMELGYGTRSEKYAANVAAIRLLKQIESEERLATPEEQEILSRYVGWGGLSDCFDERHGKYAELKALLTEDEYAAARESSLTAFYTSPVVIEAMYKALAQMGVQTGNFLEPACGVGNFMGMLPDSMAGSKFYGVELDSISGRIAQQLYQNSNIAVSGFEKVDMPDSFVDVAIGNVPFGDFKVSDRQYDKHHWLIHDYFFGKTLDKVRPGGIVAFITSKGTLDKENSNVRKYLAQRADLIGAIRLPDNAFKRNAGTEVTSDIIFLQKRDRLTDIEPEWVHLDTDENGIKMNRYFVQHPEMVMGKMVMESSRFGMDSACKAEEGADLSEQLAEAVQNLHAEITAYEREEELEEEDNSIPADPNVRNFSYTMVDGKIYYRENSRMVPVAVSATAENRIKGMIAIRDCVRKLIEYQTEDYPESYINEEQAKLNTLYDEFIEKYGIINSRANKSAFNADSSFCLLSSLEVLDDDNNFERKADMFTKRTIKQRVVVTSVDTASEALALSLAEKAKVDMPYMMELTGKTETEIFDDLKGVIFLNPEHISDYDPTPRYVPADEYLSGNVREKLELAKRSAELYPEDYTVNVEALEKVQPVDLTAAEISVRLGATWLPVPVVERFMYELFDTPLYCQRRIRVHYSKYTGEWNIENKTYDRSNVRANNTYGTDRINGYKIVEQTLNLKDVRIFDYVEDENGKRVPVLNKKETAIAQGKQELIKQAFQDWVWKDPRRREQLCQLYNKKFNSTRPREYDGSHLSLPGMNPEITLRPHQLNAIARGLYGGNELLGHVVGAGKTYTMVAIAQESKRLGLCHKNLIVVPNHLTEQWAAEYLQLFPAANILVATAKDFEKQNRKRFCGRIATGDYDAIIIGHSQLEKIPLSVERQRLFLEQQLDEIMEGIRELKANKGDNFSVKQMEKSRKDTKAKLERLNNQSRKDDLVTFEEMGIDKLFIDEAHYYKNLAAFTKMRNVAGISQTEAQKSSDLYMKVRYLDELTGNRGTVFATGTPISNTMVEMYTMQKYLQYETLRRNDLLQFDAWASTFGETITSIELAPEGTGYRAKTRFAKFYNLPELMAMFKEVADIQTADMLNLPVPKANYHNIVLKPSEMQKDMVKGLADRAEKVRNGMVAPNEDNMLVITNDGRKLALDQRLLNEMLPNSDTGKVGACAENVYEIWQQTADSRSAQLVFCDLSTPHNDGHFNVYDAMRDELISKGIPAEEIAYIHGANTEVKKKELFGKVRSGQIRVLIGSTQKMGAGTNVQQRLIALHHMDCPWRPADLQQREGRIIRQGNENPEVELYTYVTENTFDSYLYQLVESKQKFIGQIMTSKSPVRSAEDIDETALSYAEIKALCTGNPYIKEKMDLDIAVQKLRLLKSNHMSQKYALEDQIIKVFPQKISSMKQRIEGYKADIATLAENTHPNADGFSPMEVEGTVYTEKKAAGSAILAACHAMTSPDPVPLGQYRGFAMELFFDSFTREYRVTLKGALHHTLSLGTDIYGNIQRMDNMFALFEEQLHACEEQLANIHVQLANAQEQVQAPFPQEEELKTKSARLDELNILLNLDKRDNSLTDEAPEEVVLERQKVWECAR